MYLSAEITNSEWQIMRVLWQNGPSTSQKVIEEIHKINGWSPTTIKTFLSRLTKKGIVGFEKQGKAYLYSTAMTEMTCVKNEMKSIVDKVYGGVINYESEHFAFYGHQDLDYSRELAAALEVGLSRIWYLLPSRQIEKQSIYLYPSQSRLFSALGLFDGPRWLRVGHQWGILHIAPRECFDDICASSATVHGFVQLMIIQYFSQAPYWLQQGIAAYEGMWLTENRIRDVLKKLDLKIDAKEIQKLNTDYETFRSLGGYELSFAIVEFIVSKYGKNGLLTVLQNPQLPVPSFESEADRFWTECQKYIEEKYKAVR
jgi:BlaI family transcriptional regulator, penicillinase repressor